MNYIAKGNYGYIRSEKRRRLIIAAGLLLIPIIVFIIGIIVTGKRETILTVICVVGTLPACRAIVSFIMMVMRKPMNPDDYEAISKHTGSLTTAYELYITAYDKSALIDAFAICGNTVVGYVTDPQADLRYEENHITKILRSNGCSSKVNLLKDRKKFIERLDSMNEHAEALREGIRFTPDSRYPDMGIEEVIREVLLAIAL